MTGGAGFIGSAVIRHLHESTDAQIINLDKLTYAGNLENLRQVEDSRRYSLETVDICDAENVRRLFKEYEPDAVIHLAAESHVDRSIDGPAVFVQTNLVGTYVLLEAARSAWLDQGRRDNFRFIHVSTDEVYGSLGSEGFFTEATPYDPRSPYSATKAGSDHLAKAWFHTFGLPVVVTNCSNNYGPCQFPEKLIPVVIQKAISGQQIPVYGAGDNIRDWLYVDDHARAIERALDAGAPGETYNIGGWNEKTNLEVVQQICLLLNELAPAETDYREQITFVADRPGHDKRYAIDATRIRDELGWTPLETFETGLRSTVQWYLDNQDWVTRVLSGDYRLDRMGLGEKSV